MPKATFQYAATGISLALLVLFLQSCNKANNRTVSSSTPATDVSAITIPVVPVTSGLLKQDVELPAELQPFRDVKIHAKVKGFVSWIGVDRGSKVRAGQVLITLSAPELDAQCDELKAKVIGAKAAHAEALSTLEGDRAGHAEIKAKLDSDFLTLQRLRKAAREPGAIAENEIDIAQKTVEGDEARLKAAASKVSATESVVVAKLQAITAAENSVKSLEDMRNYLIVRSPLDGLITERWVHEGDMAGVEMSRAEDARPLLRLVQTSNLRLVVSVPESEVAGIRQGHKLVFTVPAYPGREFIGTVSRIGHALDVHTRTMPVELDVSNEKGELEPGMYATVKWQDKRPYATLFVPSSALASTIERTFVVRVKDGVTTIVNVKTGPTMDDKIEIVGPIKDGEQVILKASDEYKNGDHVTTKPATMQDIQSACQHHSSASSE